MAKAIRVGDQTAHGVPLTGNGSPNVFINGKPAWRAIPAGVGDGLEEATKTIKQIMDKPLFAPPDVAPDLPKIQAKMMESAAKAAQAGNPAAPGGVTTAFTTLTTATIALTAAYVAGAAVPGGEPAARTAFTKGFQAALSSAAGAAVTALGGSWDMHTCTMATPFPHGPGLATRGAQTVFINGLEAAIDEESLYEATQGPVSFSTGSQNVFIGKGVSFGGGGGGASQKHASPSKTAEPVEPGSFPDDSGLAGGPVIDPNTGEPVLLATNGEVSGLLAGPPRRVLSNEEVSAILHYAKDVFTAPPQNPTYGCFKMLTGVLDAGFNPRGRPPGSPGVAAFYGDRTATAISALRHQRRTSPTIEIQFYDSHLRAVRHRDLEPATLENSVYSSLLKMIGREDGRQGEVGTAFIIAAVCNGTHATELLVTNAGDTSPLKIIFNDPRHRGLSLPEGDEPRVVALLDKYYLKETRDLWRIFGHQDPTLQLTRVFPEPQSE